MTIFISQEEFKGFLEMFPWGIVGLAEVPVTYEDVVHGARQYFRFYLYGVAKEVENKVKLPPFDEAANEWCSRVLAMWIEEGCCVQDGKVVFSD